jgi:hypothetical protein
MPCAAQNNRALRNSSAFGGLKQSSRYSGYFSAARLREMVNTPAPFQSIIHPHLKQTILTFDVDETMAKVRELAESLK